MGVNNSNLNLGGESPIYWFKKFPNSNFERREIDGINGNICTAMEIVDFDFNGTKDIVAIIYKKDPFNFELFEKRIVFISANTKLFTTYFSI
jgi:hypothetical protein